MPTAPAPDAKPAAGLPSPAKHEKAARVLSRIFRGSPLAPHGDKGVSHFLNQADVTIGSEYNDYGGGNGRERLTISLTDPHVITAPRETAEFMLDQLSKLAPFKDAIDFSPAKEQEGKCVEYPAKAALKRIFAAEESFGPNIRALADWPGFGTEESWNRKDHALFLSKDDGGVTVTIDVPEGGATPAEVAKDLESRLPEFKKGIAARLAKKCGLGTAEEVLAKFEAQGLEFTISTKEGGGRYASGGTVTVDIRSKAQTEALKAPGGIAAVTGEARKALTKDNPLYAVSDTEADPKLQKALAHSYFTAGTPDPKVIASVIGAKDLRKWLEKALKPLAEQKPELKADIDAVLSDDRLKVFEFGKPMKMQEKNSKGSFLIDTDSKEPGKMTVTLTLPEKISVSQALTPIAEMEGKAAAPDANTAMVLDSVQLIGAMNAESKKVLEQVVEGLNKIHGEIAAPKAAAPESSIPEGQALDPYIPLARKLVSAVEEGHKAIEEASRLGAAPAKKPAFGMPDSDCPGTQAHIHALVKNALQAVHQQPTG